VLDMTDAALDVPQSQREFLRQAVTGPVEDTMEMPAERYAEAERSGSVARKSNTASLGALEYGRRLVADALRQGCLIQS